MFCLFVILIFFFTYLYPGWEGSAHDGRVLSDALCHDFEVPAGRYYPADVTDLDIGLLFATHLNFAVAS
jgi:hypothetical protein